MHRLTTPEIDELADAALDVQLQSPERVSGIRRRSSPRAASLAAEDPARKGTDQVRTALEVRHVCRPSRWRGDCATSGR